MSEIKVDDPKRGVNLKGADKTARPPTTRGVLYCGDESTQYEPSPDGQAAKIVVDK